MRVTRREDKPRPELRPLGHRIWKARKEMKLTIEEFGAVVDETNGSHLAEIERGYHAPGIPKLRQISKATGIPLEELIDLLP